MSRALPEVTDAMVDAYLQANDAYWKRTDELPTPPNKWRNGTPREATRESLRAALATLQGLSPAQATLTDELAESFYQHIAHGDAEHRTWLRRETFAWFARAAIQAALPRGEEPTTIDLSAIAAAPTKHPCTFCEGRGYRSLPRIHCIYCDGKGFMEMDATPPLAPSVVAGEATALQALEALDDLEGSARGDEPFNHAAAPLIRAYIEASIATPPAAAGAAIGWQPISTAPDETPVWLASASGHVWIGERSFQGDYWLWGNTYMAVYQRSDGTWASSSNEVDDDYQPVLWMPLPPAAPTAPSGDSK